MYLTLSIIISILTSFFITYLCYRMCRSVYRDKNADLSIKIAIPLVIIAFGFIVQGIIVMLLPGSSEFWSYLLDNLYNIATQPLFHI